MLAVVSNANKKDVLKPFSLYFLILLDVMRASKNSTQTGYNKGNYSYNLTAARHFSH